VFGSGGTAIAVNPTSCPDSEAGGKVRDRIAKSARLFADSTRGVGWVVDGSGTELFGAGNSAELSVPVRESFGRMVIHATVARMWQGGVVDLDALLHSYLPDRFPENMLLVEFASLDEAATEPTSTANARSVEVTPACDGVTRRGVYSLVTPSRAPTVRDVLDQSVGERPSTHRGTGTSCDDEAREQMVESIKQLHGPVLWNVPGEKFSYGDYVSDITELVQEMDDTGRLIADIVHEWLFVPLRMPHSSITATDDGVVIATTVADVALFFSAICGYQPPDASEVVFDRKTLQIFMSGVANTRSELGTNNARWTLGGAFELGRGILASDPYLGGFYPDHSTNPWRAGARVGQITVEPLQTSSGRQCVDFWAVDTYRGLATGGHFCVSDIQQKPAFDFRDELLW